MAGPNPQPQPYPQPQQQPQPAFAHTSHQPYGQQAAVPIPAYDPRMGKRPGRTGTKVWGIFLLLLGGMGVMGLLASLSMMLGGFSGAQFAPTLSPEAKAEMDRMAQQMVSDSLARPTFWIHSALELGVILLSLVAGFFLVIRPRALGGKLALARVLLVVLSLPIYAYETDVAMQTTMASQEAMMRIQIEHEKKRSGSSKGPDTDQMMDMMGKIMRGTGYGVMVVTIIGILVINGLLAFHMTRPHVKEYLAGAASDNQVIPGYDPSMGMMMPPPGAPPGPQAPAPPPPGGA